MTNRSELKAECARQSFSQKRVAEIIDKTEATVSKIFKGEAEFSLADCTKLSDALNLDYQRRGEIFLSNNLTKL